MSNVEVRGVLLNYHMNNVELPVEVLKKNTVGRKNKTVVSKKNTFDVELPEAARKFAFGVVFDVEVPSVLLNDNMNNFDVPGVVIKKNTVEKKKEYL